MKQFSFLIAFLLAGVVGYSQCVDSIVVDFETSCGSWTTGKLSPPSSTTWVCGMPNKSIINGTTSGTNAWVNGDTTGTYDASEESYVESPFYDMSCFQDPYLKVNIWWEVEDSWDAAALQYSTDSGNTWNDIGAAGDSNCITKNWYNETNVGALQTNNQHGWSGHNDTSYGGSCDPPGAGSGQWVTAQHCIAFLAGEPDVKFRFVFGSGSICQAEGFAFDDFEIWETKRPTVSISPASPSICQGDTITLNTSSSACADSFQWSTGATTPSIDVYPPQDSTYTVTTFKTLCDTVKTNHDTVTVSVTIVNASVTGDTASCAADSITMIAAGGSSYQWNTGATSDSIRIKVDQDSTFWVEVTENTCIDTAFHSVQVDSIVSPAIGGVDSICPGDTATLTATGAPQYQWVTGATTNSIDVSPSNDSTYWVVGQNGLCHDTAYHSVALYPAVNAGITGGNMTCEEDTVNLTASGGNNYVWNTGDSTVLIAVSPNRDTTYSVTAFSVNGCSDTALHTIQVDSAVAPSISGTDTICSGDSVTLNASGAPTYQWSTGSGGNTIVVAPASDSTYWVRGQNGLCSDTAFYTITVASSITANISGPDSSCSDEMIVLVASGGTGYEWSNGSINDSLIISAAQDTTVWVRATSGSCFDTAFHTVAVDSNITTAVTGTDSICLGDSITLVASGAPQYTWSTGDTGNTIMTAPPADSSYWVAGQNGQCRDTSFKTVAVSPPVSAGINAPDSVCAGSAVTLIASGGNNYTWSNGNTSDTIVITSTQDTSLWVESSNARCSDTAFHSITVLPQVNAAISGNDTICEGDTASLSVSGTGQYQWSTGDTTPAIAVTPLNTTTYQVTIANARCADTATHTVVVLDQQNVSITGPAAICPEDTVQLQASGGNSYTWNTGANSSSIIIHPDQPTWYAVTVTNRCGTFVDSALVDLYALPNAQAYQDTTIREGEQVRLNASGGQSFWWMPDTALSCRTCPDPVAQPSRDISYIVTVTDSNGCTGFDTVTITVAFVVEKELYIPTVFSPNSDGSNDIWKIHGEIRDIHVFVYDRWGEKVFETEDINEGWDGTFRDKKLPTGVFVYYVKVTLSSGKEIERKGNLTLLR